jgi:hypothetical protein
MKTEAANRKHLEAIEALRVARDEHERAKDAYGDLIAREVRGQGIAEAIILRAGSERDKAAGKVERAGIALTAAEAALRDAEAADAAAAIERGWAEAAKIAENYRAEVRKLAALARDADATIAKILDFGLAISAVSPAQKQRPDVTDLGPSKLRARMQRAVELSLPQLYAATPETRHAFPGLEPRLLESLGFYLLRNTEAAAE